MSQLRLSRRRFIHGSLCLTVTSSFSETSGLGKNGESSTATRFQAALNQFERDPGFAEAQRANREIDLALDSGLEQAPIRASKSSTPISTRADSLIIACEVTSGRVYRTRYQNPVWPGGASGVTIGVGYDVGYATPEQLVEDWGGYIGQQQLTELTSACGTAGPEARRFLPGLSHILIGWDVARDQYAAQIRPRYVGAAESALPNTKSLKSDSLGALVSLVYNRGPSFSLSGPRYAEMRNIKAHMLSGRLDKIPEEIRHMKRLWKGNPGLRGLLLRRDAEADLFQLGLPA